MQNIFVVGYYNKENIGDDQYTMTIEYFLKKYFKDCKVVFVNCDDFYKIKVQKSDLIVVGGGDVLNDYFMDKIIKTVSKLDNVIIGLSCGIPYKNIVYTKKLEIFNYIICRSKTDYELLSTQINENKLLYLPDFSVFLKGVTDVECEYSAILKEASVKHDIICISVNGHFKNTENKIEYDKMIIIFRNIIKRLSRKYYIVLLPFDYKKDIPIHNELCEGIHSSNILNIDKKLDVSQTLSLFNFFKLSIPMKYHACMFSFIKNVPMFPVFVSQKISNLIADINCPYYYKLPADEKDFPKDINEEVIIDGINKTLFLKLDFEKIHKVMMANFDFLEFKNVLVKKIEYKKTSLVNQKTLKIKECFEKVKEFIKEYPLSEDVVLSDEQKQDTVKIASYILTGSTNSAYNYGLMEKMFKKDYDYIKEWSWIINDHYYISLRNQRNLKSGVFNMTFIDQIDYSGAHRSGWQYVYDQLLPFNNKDSDLYLDMYVDRTFHWNKKINKFLNLIPYKKNWIGFIHHTFDTDFSEYNCVELLKNQDFIESLKKCKGLIVLSRYLQTLLQRQLFRLNINVKVWSLCHPTETNVPLFDLKKFVINDDKKLLFIGGWLRNTYSFYQLCLKERINIKSMCLTRSFDIRKAFIKGVHMNNYHPSKNFKTDLLNMLKCEEEQSSEKCKNISTCPNVSKCICSPNVSRCISVCPNVSRCISANVSVDIKNNWNKFYFDSVVKTLQSVDIISKLSNDDYDTILTENIVIINLTDASAVNTLLECMARNTPIIINDLPAVVELLGKNYPLYITCEHDDYYSFNIQVNNLIKDFKNIEKAHKYLKSLDKKKLHVDFFIKKLLNIVSDLK